MEKQEVSMEEEVDVPADFFDDLLNKDFLEGLDVIVASEDEERKSSSKILKTTKEELVKNATPLEKVSQPKGKPAIKINLEFKRNHTEAVKKSSSQSSKSSRSKDTKSLEERADEILRRDPSKTRRDIAKDKEKSLKDKEKKAINEKLRVVETGLVPPGMEMEVDIKEIKANHSPIANKRSENAVESPFARATRGTISNYRNRSPSPTNRGRGSPNRRIRSPPSSNIRHSPSRRKLSPSLRHNRSPHRRRTPPRTVRKRNRSRSPHRSHSYGKRSRDRSHSKSPVQRKPFLVELREKLMEEERQKIESKLNGFQPLPMYQAVQPVYDQQYFIGRPAIMPVAPYPYSMSSHEQTRMVFDDPNVSFTDILKRYKSEMAPSLMMQDKIRVITRCQDAVKLLMDSERPSGRFFFRKQSLRDDREGSGSKTVIGTNSTKSETRNSLFRFTTEGGIVEYLNQPTTFLLRKLGFREVPVVKNVPTSKPAATTTDAMTQTEDAWCNECDIRKQTLMTSEGTQCVIDTTEFSCQVTEENFLVTARSALQNILKTQSLATLTPAQIMAKAKEKAALSSDDPTHQRMLEHVALKPMVLGERRPVPMACAPIDAGSRRYDDSYVGGDRNRNDEYSGYGPPAGDHHQFMQSNARGGPPGRFNNPNSSGYRGPPNYYYDYYNDRF